MRKYRFVILSMLVLSVFMYSGNGQVWAKDPQIVLKPIFNSFTTNIAFYKTYSRDHK